MGNVLPLKTVPKIRDCPACSASLILRIEAFRVRCAASTRTIPSVNSASNAASLEMPATGPSITLYSNSPRNSAKRESQYRPAPVSIPSVGPTSASCQRLRSILVEGFFEAEASEFPRAPPRLRTTMEISEEVSEARARPTCRQISATSRFEPAALKTTCLTGVPLGPKKTRRTRVLICSCANASADHSPMSESAAWCAD